MAVSCTRTNGGPSIVIHIVSIGIDAGGTRYDGKVGLVDGGVGRLSSISAHHVGADFAFALMAIEIVACCKGRAA